MTESLEINSRWHGILVYLEYHYGKIEPVSLELIGCAVRLSEQNRCEIYGIVIGAGLNAAKAQLAGLPIDKVFLFEAGEMMLADIYHKHIVTCINELKPAVVLIGGTREGRSLAPGLAAYYQTGLTADCTELAMTDSGGLLQVRPAFGGDIMAQIVTPDSRPQMATVRPGIMSAAERSPLNHPEFIAGQSKPPVQSAFEILKTLPVETDSAIAGAKVLVAGGRGIKKKEDMMLLHELALLLGAKVAGSRGLVEKGFIGQEYQIGLSGYAVKPELLIAAGISGSIQFCTGVKKAKYIIAINQDEDAEILNAAHLPIVGDLYEVIPQVIEMLKHKC